MKFALMALLMILANCNGQRKKGTKAAEPKTQAIETLQAQRSDDRLTLVVSDRYSGIETAETLIVKDAKSLQKFYSKINRTRKPGLPVPDIDFSKETVVVHCSGITDEGAMPYMYVENETEEEIVLGVGKTIEDSSFSAVTTPFCVYRIAVTDKIILSGEAE